MAKRDQFLNLVDSCNEEELCQFIEKCRTDEAGGQCMQEMFGSCSRKQLNHAWQKVYTLVSQTLTSFTGTFDSDSEDPEYSAHLKHILEVTPCLVSMISAMIRQKEVYIPEYLYKTALLLQGILPCLPEQEDKTRNAVAGLFEDWWKKNLPQRDSLIITSMVFIVERSLDLLPRPLIADVKRAWSLHDVLLLIDMENESSADFKELLRRCFISQPYLQQPEGVRFLGYVMSLDENFAEDVHRTIKNHLLALPRSWCEGYGEVYFRTWQQTTGVRQQKLEQNCIQDLMYQAVHAQPALLPYLKKMLSYIHRQKKQRGADEMLCRLYEPILWRSLRVANCEVRYNAAVLFFDVFPLQNPDHNVQESDQLMQKQFDLFTELLYDPFPNVRRLSVTGILHVMKTYWEVIPTETLKKLLINIIQDLLLDANSSDVRQSVIKGLTLLLDNPLSHPFLKVSLPQVRNAFHDVSEKVRVAMIDLLMKVKTLRTIKYWSIVPIDHLLARLVIDDGPVNRRIVKLIQPSFIPLKEPGDVQLERCAALIKSNPAAARQLFKYAAEMMSLDNTVKYMTMLCKALLTAIKRNSENGNDNNSGSEDAEAVDSGDEDLKVSNTPLMLGFCEIILILWTLNENTLKEEANVQYKKAIEKKFSYALPEMLHTFSEPEIVSVLIQIAGHLPANYIPTVSRAWVPKLRNMTSENTKDDYCMILSSVCEVGRGCDILELVSDWLTSCFKKETKEGPTNAKVGKKMRKVGFVEERQPQPQLGLDFLSFILQHHHTQETVLRDNHKECAAIRDLLKGCMTCIEQCLKGETTEQSPDHKLLQDSFVLYFKLCLLLHSMDNKNYSCISEFATVLSWVDSEVLPVLNVKEEHNVSGGLKRPLATGAADLARNIIQSTLVAFNNMLLVGIGDETLCTKLVNFCTACLTADRSLCHHCDVMLCLYQVTEYMRFSDTVDNHWTSSTIPTALSRVFVNIASYVQQTSDNSCQKLLHCMRGPVIELLKAVFTGQSHDDSILHDVMATILATILAELAHNSSQYELEEDCSPTLLPAVSAWLLDIVQSRPELFRSFVQEVSSFVESEAIEGLHSFHGTVHLLGSLTKCKRRVENVTDLWTVIQRGFNKQVEQQTQEHTDRELITAIETKLKAVQIT